MNIPFRPLGPLMQLLEELGHEVTYAYDDLVFINNNDFLIQFASSGPELHLFFNHDCNKNTASGIEESIIPAAESKGLSIIRKGKYKLVGEQDETMQLHFFDA
ncbi:hypothetical protein [Chlorobium phaeovibrioides]|uniref:hypothetical protein n=1 Tax=Chlorobium phaeovibrioides TaxID=1094 RepID=UPI00123051F2|nr:hypothetical protein [Chlorobium phaeovibrioides]QEQ56802.1 hypothetical protein FNV82_03600 [Chlorobium phaeovibrioides]